MRFRTKGTQGEEVELIIEADSLREAALKLRAFDSNQIPLPEEGRLEVIPDKD